MRARIGILALVIGILLTNIIGVFAFVADVQMPRNSGDTASVGNIISFNPQQRYFVTDNQGEIYFFFQQQNSGSRRLYFIKSVDEGVTWGSAVTINVESNPEIQGWGMWYGKWTSSLDTQVVYIAWNDTTDHSIGGITHTYFRKISLDTDTISSEVEAGNFVSGTSPNGYPLAITRAFEGDLYIITEGSVIRSTNQGTSWSNISGTGLELDSGTKVLLTLPLTYTLPGHTHDIWAISDTSSGANINLTSYDAGTNTWTNNVVSTDGAAGKVAGISAIMNELNNYKIYITWATKPTGSTETLHIGQLDVDASFTELPAIYKDTTLHSATSVQLWTNSNRICASYMGIESDTTKGVATKCAIMDTATRRTIIGWDHEERADLSNLSNGKSAIGAENTGDNAFNGHAITRWIDGTNSQLYINNAPVGGSPIITNPTPAPDPSNWMVTITNTIGLNDPLGRSIVTIVVSAFFLVLCLAARTPPIITLAVALVSVLAFASIAFVPAEVILTGFLAIGLILLVIGFSLGKGKGGESSGG